MTTPAVIVEASKGANRRPGRLSRAPGAIVRLAVFAMLGIGFVWLATEFDPVQSSAQFRARAGAGQNTTPLKPPRGKLLGTLVGGPYTIRIHACGRRTLYSVWDARTGKALAEDLWADEVYRHFPDLDPRQLHVSPEHADDREDLLGPLMTAEQHNGDVP